MNRSRSFSRLALRGLAKVAVLVTAGLWLLVAVPPLQRSETLRILDRCGRELYQLLGPDKARTASLALPDISPWLVRATLFKEDRAFYRHPGVNPLTLGRALLANIRSGRVAQGGSTITMQLAKILRQRSRRGFFDKFAEMALALKLEMTLDKGEILTQYLNRIYYGNQLFGCQAAAQSYFGRPARDLTLAQAAFLSALTSAPSLYNPYLRFEELVAKSRRQIREMRQKGWIGREAEQIALAENLTLLRPRHPLLAPHFVFSLLAAEEKRIYGLREIRASIDIELQQEAEAMLRSFVGALAERGVRQGALLVLDNRSGETLAWVGSTDFWNQASSGQIDGCLIRRQPGSTLKPLLYACALRSGFHAASILSDLPATFRDGEKLYVPRNYNGLFTGPQRLRVALASSLNIPAVQVLEKVGQGRFFDLLKRCGFDSLGRGEKYYGLGLALGSGEVTLLELARAFAALARGGLYLPERRVLSRAGRAGGVEIERPPRPRRVLDAREAAVIGSILSDNDSRGLGFSEDSPLSFPYQVAVKTGTSEGFRDNFCIGYTRDYTVAVWVGNFEGQSMKNVSGVTGAGPVFHAALNLVYRRLEGRLPYGSRGLDPTLGALVHREICPLSGMLAGEDCPGRIEEFFIPGQVPEAACDWHRLLEVDSRNLLLAGPQTPVAYRQKKLFLKPPAAFREWAVHAGLQPPPPQRSSDLGAHEFQITFPVDRAIFQHLADLPMEYQSLKLKLKTSLRGQRVVWRVDERVIARVGFPFSAYWRISPGAHLIKAESEDRKFSSRAQIFVQ